MNAKKCFKTLPPLITFTLFSQQGLARDMGINSGALYSTGPSSSQYTIFAGHTNPAIGSIMVDDNEDWRFGFGNITSVTEVGQVDNFIDDLDELIDIIDDPSSSDDSISDTLDRFNAILEKMGDEGYALTTLNVSIPGFPMYYKSNRLGGTIFGEFSYGLQVDMSVLDDELVFNNGSNSIDTSTSVYIKSGIEKKIGVGYSRELTELPLFEELPGTLHAGVKANIINLELSKQVVLLTSLDGQGIEDVVEDSYNDNLVSTTALGIDLGVLWEWEQLRLGFSITDINSPSFDYGAIGVNCERFGENTEARTNCEVTKNFTETRGDIKARESHTRHALSSVNGTYFLTKKWSFSSSLDLGAYNDPVGREHQYFHLGTAYTPTNYIVPASRFGYRTNLTGSKISSIAFGFTFFGWLTTDLEWGLTKAEVDGSSFPRRFGFSIGIEERF